MRPYALVLPKVNTGLYVHRNRAMQIINRRIVINTAKHKCPTPGRWIFNISYNLSSFKAD